jgi:hypothetical protein
MGWLAATLLALATEGDGGTASTLFAPARYRGRPFETEHAIRYVVPGRR